MVVLNNEYLKVELEPKGAEISKIIGKQDNINYMWKQDPVLWGHSAPILFPIVGALRNGEYTMEGKKYAMNQHGFSRNSVYDIVEQDETHVIFHLASNEEIEKMYPLEFDLYVAYTLVGQRLKADLRVVNNKEEDLYFQIGGHPAFACPFIEGEDANDYYIEFSEPETCEKKIIDVPKKGMSHETKPLFDHERHFFVRQAMFDNDAVVVKNFKSESIALRSLCNDKAIVFHMHNFDHVGLWASSHVGGLIAIEPWVGHSDYIDFNGEFKDKESCVDLKKGKEFVCNFEIEINQ